MQFVSLKYLSRFLYLDLEKETGSKHVKKGTIKSRATELYRDQFFSTSKPALAIRTSSLP